MRVKVPPFIAVIVVALQFGGEHFRGRFLGGVA